MEDFQKKLFAGVDPGLNGGITIIDTDGKIIFKTVMPILELKNGKKIKKECNGKVILDIILNYCPKIVGIESQQAFPRQGVSSTFKTGRGFGLLEGIMIGSKTPYVLIRPQEWQKEMFKGYPKDKGKGLSIMIANSLAPEEDFRKSERCANYHDGLTDSFCLATYMRRFL